MSKLIVGCGYVGHRLARRWSAAGEKVYVTTRNPDRAKAFQEEGLTPVLLDVTQTKFPALPAADTTVFAVGFDRSASHTIEEVYVDGLRHFLNACPTSGQQFIYVSSTGVYGQTDGGTVDEDSDCQPNRPGGVACLAAETLLSEHPQWGSKSVVLRLAGIYGPDRLPQLRLLERGDPLEVDAEAWLNLIHVDDAVGVINLCSRQSAPPPLLCVSDGSPTKRKDFYRHLASLLQLPEPKFAPPAPDSSQASRARGSKQISNQRLVDTLDYQFAYPSFREGLRSIVETRSQ